jgi:hypothetical protein
MTYVLSKYLSDIPNSSPVTHVLVAERPWYLEGEFAFLKISTKEELFIVFIKANSLSAAFLKKKILSSFV